MALPAPAVPLLPLFLSAVLLLTPTSFSPLKGSESLVAPATQVTCHAASVIHGVLPPALESHAASRHPSGVRLTDLLWSWASQGTMPGSISLSVKWGKISAD